MTTLIDRFAAHLAHSLNAPPPGPVTVAPGAVYALLTTTLSRPAYLGRLLYHPAYGWRMPAEEAVTRYFDATIARRLRLSGRSDRSVAHRLFGALCQRGHGPGWDGSTLARSSAEAAAAENVVAFAPAGLRGVADRLSGLPRDIAPGNAAATIRQRQGPLWLTLGEARFEVAEEFSVWDAIRVGPEHLSALAEGEPFNRFCGVVIDALRTANRPVQELLSLGRGLCPFDWLDSVPVNQVRALRRFLALLPEGPDGAPLDSPETWAAAFAQRPVPGHADWRALWNSELGQAMRNRGATAPAALAAAHPDEDRDEGGQADGEAAGEGQSGRPRVMGAGEFDETLARLEAAARISAAERMFLRRIYEGVPLAAALAETGLAAQIAARGDSPETFVTALHARLAGGSEGGRRHGG